MSIRFFGFRLVGCRADQVVGVLHRSVDEPVHARLILHEIVAPLDVAVHVLKPDLLRQVVLVEVAVDEAFGFVGRGEVFPEVAVVDDHLHDQIASHGASPPCRRWRRSRQPRPW